MKQSQLNTGEYAYEKSFGQSKSMRYWQKTKKVKVVDPHHPKPLIGKKGKIVRDTSVLVQFEDGTYEHCHPSDLLSTWSDYEKKLAHERDEQEEQWAKQDRIKKARLQDARKENEKAVRLAQQISSFGFEVTEKSLPDYTISIENEDRYPEEKWLPKDTFTFTMDEMKKLLEILQK